MKKWTKIIAVILCLAAFASLAACGGKELRTDVPAPDIAEKVAKAIDKPQGLTTVDENYVAGRLQVDLSKCSEYVVRINSFGTDVDEFGVFKAKDEEAAKAVAAQVQAYLDNRLATWMDEYMPEEKPKVENAEVKVSGVYVLYGILSDSARKAAFSALDEAIS